MTDVTHTQLFIGGQWQDSLSGEEFSICNPARPDEVVGFAANGNVADIDAACESAAAAFPQWSSLSYQERAAYLHRVAEHLVADAVELEKRISLFTREHGKILQEASIEMRRFGDRFLLCADYAERLEQDEQLQGPPFDTVITRQARGVAALVVPWNWPISILGAKLPQALMAGNTVVIKPSKESALAPALTIGRVAEVLPAGVVNLVTGSSSRIGDPLLTHPLVRTINFTGSVPVGRHVMKMAADNLVPVTLELGGNDAGLILEDAELDADAFRRMYLASFMSSGQICMALKRIYVHRSRYDELVDGLSAVCSQQVVGDGLLPETTMGPVNNRGQYDIVIGMIEQAKRAGAEVRELGQVPDQDLYDRGYFQKPTLVLNPDAALDIVKEEQFGPAVPIIPFDTEEEAIGFANDSEFGLCSSVWTPDRERAMNIARKLEAGYTYLNGHGPLAQDGRAPFGGFKSSGIGRNLGFEGIQAFQEPHAISAPAGWLL
ncbi:aldehyde dehydrogenase family protein [Pseudomaricurvus alkylphenolicus]|uniref:aldehyde dehydrogenase family protein n=1 Tax=Pseudomaricurvus alkylphenolicus TaxID=1306991 RepID=UPI0014208CC7|nr:aldehyde dehydrogenase family protein [Pseudomaricurvus alkylphenolicus]NIB38520.1 aldehyde dehydrogenase family protein [Pseudomaricurvus alkylphenolicus]